MNYPIFGDSIPTPIFLLLVAIGVTALIVRWWKQHQKIKNWKKLNQK